MKHEAWFFIGLLVFIFVIWIAVGGPVHRPNINVPTLPAVGLSSTTATTAATGHSYFSLPHAPFAIGDSNTVLLSSSGGESISSGGSDSSSGVSPFNLVPGVSYAPASPYRGVVSMSSYVSSASSTDARSEYVQLSVSSSATLPVDITGWKLVSGASGCSARIPAGTAVPTSGVVNPTSDIVLGPGESAIIVSGESPVGASFRENKCTGYFNGFQSFTPSLPQQCPSASSELATFYGRPYIHDPACIDYADSLATCRVPTRTGSAKLTSTCQAFLETYLNYNDCLTLHRNDADFDGRVWRIYLGRDTDEPLWRTRHEVVELLDRDGRTVDTFSY